MSELDQARSALARLCDDLLREDSPDSSMRRLVHDARDRLAPAPFYVVVCGEYGRGKSTLLSALAGRRGLFPHEPNDTTSIATVLAWGPDPTAVVSFAVTAESPSAPVTIALDDVRRYVTETANRHNALAVLAVEMRAPVESLRTGLVLVDTPGVNSRLAAHNIATRQYLQRADAVLFVASADETLSKLELSALELSALGQLPPDTPVVAVLAKADMAGAAALAPSASERVSAALGRPVEVLPVSAVMLLDALDDGIESFAARSAIPELARRLAALRLPHQARAMLAARPLLVRALTLLAEPYLRELDALQRAAREVDAVERERALVQAQVEELDATTQRLRSELPTWVEKGVRGIRDDVASRCAALTFRVELDRSARDPEIEPSEYLRGVLDDLAEIANAADAQRAALTARLTEQANGYAQAELAPSAPADSLRSALRLPSSALLPSTRPGFTLAALREGAAEGVKLAAVTGTVGSVVGTLVAAAPGAAAGATIGALLGHMVGWVGGTREAIKKARQESRTAAFRALAELAPGWIAKAAQDLDGHLQSATKATATDLGAVFGAAVAERRDRLQVFLRNAGPERTGEMATDRLARIDAVSHRIARYERLSRELTEVVEVLERLAG